MCDENIGSKGKCVVHQFIRGELRGVFYWYAVNIMVRDWEMGGDGALVSEASNEKQCCKLSSLSLWLHLLDTKSNPNRLWWSWLSMLFYQCSLRLKMWWEISFSFFFFYSFSTFNTIECILCIVNMWYWKCIRVLKLFENVSFHCIVLLPTSIQIKLNKNNLIWTDVYIFVNFRKHPQGLDGPNTTRTPLTPGKDGGPPCSAETNEVIRTADHKMCFCCMSVVLHYRPNSLTFGRLGWIGFVTWIMNTVVCLVTWVKVRVRFSVCLHSTVVTPDLRDLE